MNISNIECLPLNNGHQSLVLFMGFYGLLIIESVYLCVKQIWKLRR